MLKNKDKSKQINRFYGTGRRKASVARVYMSEGEGVININGKTSDIYFSRSNSYMIITQPLSTVDMLNKFNFSITVSGGGESGQAGAILLGISRALVEYDSGLKSALSSKGFMTRDSRIVERKKCGLRKARRSKQFSKR